MNNQQGVAAPALLPLEKLVKPEMVQQLAFLTPEQKAQSHKGINSLWDRINNSPNDQERTAAHKRLSEISQQLRRQMVKWQQENQGQANQNQIQLQQAQQQAHQQAQQQAQQQALQPQMAVQQAQAQAQARAQAQAQQNNQGSQGAQQLQQAPAKQPQTFSAKVMQLARELKVQIPPNIKASPHDEQQRWVNSERRRYAEALQKFEAAQVQLENFKAQATERNAKQRFTPEDAEKVKQRVSALTQNAQEMRRQSLIIKQQHEGQRPPQAGGPQQPGQAQQQDQKSQQASQLPGQPGQPGQPTPGQQQPAQAQQGKQDTNKDTTKQDGGETKPEVSATASMPTSQPPAQAQPQAPAQSGQGQSVPTPTQTQPQPGVAKPPTPSSAVPPQAGQTGQAAGGNAPQSLTPQMALDLAARNSQSLQPPPHGHPPQTAQQQSIQREQGLAQATPSSRPPTRPLNVTPLQPVTLAPARPTLMGGQGPVGAMGQPGIQKPPAFSLEGDTDRVLSKKKLDDLVRQVTGSAGGEGAESLDPDVEETLLDIADEFVDNVITQACRLAKLRSSAQLELRDIQLILERNYNIRVPGFASDELRTVKKIQPTQSWTQKMSAVQAAKVTGGKADI